MLSRQMIKKIEAYFREKTGRSVYYLPSARLGIYASLCELFPAGAGLVLSPVTDDIVLFAVLAAGLQPIFIDIEPNSGGLRPDRIPDAVDSGAVGVLTSNLYGIPDDVSTIRKICDERGLILIEDCAHAMGCEVEGRRVGTFGEVSVFSLAKHIGGRGGVVTSTNPEWVERIRKHAERYVKHPSSTASLVESARQVVSEALGRFPRMRRVLKTFAFPLLRFFPDPYVLDEEGFEREGHRVPIRKEDFNGWKERKGLEPYHRYLEVDNHRYNETPCWCALRKNVDALRRFDESVRSYQTAPDRIDPKLAVKRGTPEKGGLASYYKIPFFLKDRDRHSGRLAEMGVALDHIYDPPFPDYLPSGLFKDCVTDKKTSLRWSREVLPVPLPQLERACAYLSTCDGTGRSADLDRERASFVEAPDRRG